MKLVQQALITNLTRSLFNNNNLNKNATTLMLIERGYAAKKAPALTEAQLQFQKHTAELGFREKKSIKGTKYEYHDVDTSIEYMKSEAFKKAYGEKLIWEWYIRNFKGRFPKSYTRKQCIHNGRYTIGNPCPICRDPYLVVSYNNLDLLRHFVSPDSGYLYPTIKSNVCQKQHENLEIAYEKACDYGLLDHPIPHRYYDYSLYYPEIIKQESSYRKATSKASTTEGSVLLGIVLGSKRKNVNNIFDELKEEDIKVKAK